MKIKIHPHAAKRMGERGATVTQVRLTVQQGRSMPAKFGRTQFRHVFPFDRVWNGKRYARMQVNAFAAIIPGGWLVVTVIVKYF